MEPLTAGSVVLVQFPFSDLSKSKLRPAVVLAAVGRDDFVLCQITSNPYGDETAVELREDSFATGSLTHVSYVRPGKLFTANSTLVQRVVARLTSSALEDVRRRVVNLIQPNAGSRDASPGHEVREPPSTR